MGNDRKEFYKRLAENSLRDIKIQRDIKTTRTNTYNYTNRYKNKTKNGMIRFDEQTTPNTKSKFLTQAIICIIILGVFYYLVNSNSSMANNIINKTKNILESELNIDSKIADIFSKFNVKTGSNKNGVSIDDDIIEQMEKEIENTQKK
ncbi:hypothetical protein [uncultured Tyzzerella sp.]|uniref:hypothetical protein n=1 Tax=uncultured Tyzzerella sp. TaxID=2321398 RepID=UPI0029426FB8|nr:hypothetical protein [uncultured Tyzzerella sp.]